MKERETMLFFYFMWNYWSHDNCCEAFKTAKCGAEYLWKRYCGLYDTEGAHGAISAFLAYLDFENTKLLIDYAVNYMCDCCGYIKI